MDAILRLAVVLTAYDKMSDTVNHATSKAQKAFGEMGKNFLEGAGLIEAGKKLGSSLQPAIDAFAEAQEAGNSLKASMLDKGGMLDEGTYNKIYSMANNLSDNYKGSTASYLEMVKVLKNNRVGEKDILNGVGEATAKLADYFQMAPASIAEFSAHMMNDMGVKTAKEMQDMMDLTARIHDAGVGKTGEEAVTQMNEFFSKASLGAQNLGVTGLKASKELGVLGSMFIARGLSGATVGTNIRRILSGIGDKGSMDKVNAVAAQYGKHLTLFEKDGKFKSIKNLTDELGKLENLSPQAIAAILKPLGGKKGLSDEFLKNLAENGLKGFGEFNKKVENQAELGTKLKVIMGGVNYQQGVMETSWTNLKSSFGSSMKPVLDLFYSGMNNIITSVRKFLDEHPRVAKFASAFIALASAALMMAGVVKIIQGIKFAMQALNITMAANPFVLIAIAAVLAVSLIYTYWDKISAFFVKLWDGIKAIFKPVIDFIWNFIKYFTPIGIIIQFWEPLKKFFSAIWDFIKAVFTLGVTIIKGLMLLPVIIIMKIWKAVGPWFIKNVWDPIKKPVMGIFHTIVKIFTGIVDFVFGIGKKLYQAGVNIVTSIVNGITSVIHKITDVIKGITQKIRNFLPFSPAKEGPLKDIHKIKLIETIADTIKPTSLFNAVKRVTGGVFNFFNKSVLGSPAMQASGAGGGGMVANFNIYLNGNGSKADGVLIAAECKKQFQQWMKQYGNQQARVSFH